MPPVATSPREAYEPDVDAEPDFEFDPDLERRAASDPEENLDLAERWDPDTALNRGEASGADGTVPPPIAAPSPTPPPRDPPAGRPAWVLPTVTLLAAFLLIGVAFEFGRRSVQPGTSGSPSAEPLPPPSAVVAEETGEEPAPTPPDRLPPVASAPPDVLDSHLAHPESTLSTSPEDVDPPAPDVVEAPPPAPAPAASPRPAASVPREPRAARASDGWIEIEVVGGEPGEAWIDWQHVGRTPVMRAAVSPRSHVVTLVLEDGTRVRKTVEVEPEKGSKVRFYLD
jgi:hypothetical protein